MRVRRLSWAIMLTVRQGGMDDSTLALPFNFAGFPRLALEAIYVGQIALAALMVLSVLVSVVLHYRGMNQPKETP